MSNEKMTALYGVTTAILTALAVFGWINAEQQEMLVAAVGATLGVVSQLISTVRTWNQREIMATARSSDSGTGTSFFDDEDE